MSQKNLDAILKNVSQVKTILEKTLKNSKSIVSKSASVVSQGIHNKTIHTSLDATSKGVDAAVEGLKFASKNALKLASTLEKSSEKIKKMGVKFNRKG